MCTGHVRLWLVLSHTMLLEPNIPSVFGCRCMWTAYVRLRLGLAWPHAPNTVSAVCWWPATTSLWTSSAQPQHAVSHLSQCCRLLVDCNQLAVDVDNEIAVIHNFMRDKYRLKFPELESLVHHPIDYARVIQAIGEGAMSSSSVSRP